MMIMRFTAYVGGMIMLFEAGRASVISTPTLTATGIVGGVALIVAASLRRVPR